MPPTTETKTYLEAAEIIAKAEALLVCAGSGMGVDSGLPDFRGPEGFWSAYPAAQGLGLDFQALANPKWFQTDPELAWGFYGHRYQTYCDTVPHAGFEILRKWATKKDHGYFVFTSNVDGQFQKAGFDDDYVAECHGSVMFLQCVKPCCAASWPVPKETAFEINQETLHAKGDFPSCVCCKGLARPNVLMFDDESWSAGRASAQQIRFRLWLRGLARGKLAVIELGAGTAIPTVRENSERVAQAAGTRLIRINPLDSQGPSSCLSITEGALPALRRLDETIAGL